MAIDMPARFSVVSKFRSPGATNSRASRDSGLKGFPAHRHYNAKSACRFNPWPHSAVLIPHSTVTRSRHKSRGGPTGRPMILAPTRELRSSGKGQRVPSEQGKGRRYAQ